MNSPNEKPSSNHSPQGSYQDFVAKLSAGESDVSRLDEARISEARQTIRERETERRGREQYYRLRIFWSRIVAATIAFILIFQFTLTILVGMGSLDFQQYSWFLPLVMGQNVLQIIALGTIIVKFLYPSSR